MINEVKWTWPQIAVALMWRFAPDGTIVRRRDLAGLPADRVLLEDRRPDRIEFSWVKIEEAQRRAHSLAIPGKAEERATVSEMQGRWQKMAVVLLWKFTRGSTIALRELDLSAVPADKVLLAEGHEHDIEYRFCPRTEAQVIAKREKDNEGRIITEVFRR